MSEQELDPRAVAPDASPEAEQATGAPDVRQPAPKVNLDEIPEFRQWKSTMDKQLSGLTKQQQAIQQQAEDARLRAMQLEQQLQYQQMQGMTELEQANYRAQLAEQNLTRERENARLREQAWQRERDLDAISRETGAPRDVIEDATDPMDAWKKAYGWLRSSTDTRVKQQVEATVEKRIANQVDIGGGTAPDAGDDLQRQYDRAMKEYDSGQALKIMSDALRKGVKLKL